MNLFGKMTKRLNIILLIVVWMSSAYIFGIFSYIALLLLLLLFQVIFAYAFDSQIQREKVNQGALIIIALLGLLTGSIGIIIIIFTEFPLWYKIFALFAQGAFVYAELKMLIEVRGIIKNR